MSLAAIQFRHWYLHELRAGLASLPLAMAGVVLAMVFVRPIVDFIADHMGREAALNAHGGHVWGSGCGARSARCSRRPTGPMLYKNC